MTLAELVLFVAAGFAGAAGVVAAGRKRVVLSPLLLPWLTLASAVLAATAPGTPVGTPWLDIAWRAAAGSGFVILAYRASGRAWLLASALVLPSALASPLGWLAFLVFGAGIAFSLSQPRLVLLRALSAGCLVQVFLRLEEIQSWPSSATVVAAATAVLALSAFARSGKEGKRHCFRTLALGGGLVFAASAAWAIAVVIARPSMVGGVRAATEGLAAARGGDARHAAARFSAAADSFSSARRTVGAWWAQPALVVPVVGRNARAVSLMAATGTSVAEAAAGATPSLEPSSLRLVAGVVPIEGVRALERPLRKSAVVLNRSVRSLRAARSSLLLPPVAERLRRLSIAVESGRRDTLSALDVVTVVPSLLGADGPRRYFLAMQTPSELRATGGLIGNFGEIRADRGRLELVRVGRSSDLNEGGTPAARRLVGPPDYLTRYQSFHPEKDWRNVNMSPHFPSVAEVVTSLYPQSGGQAIDGVISVDPLGLVALLKVVGPVSVAGFDESLTAENAAEMLLFGQYLRFQETNDERIEFLGAAATAVWSRLTSVALPGPAELGNALGPAVKGKHFLFNSRHRDEQRALERLGIDGGLAALRGDSLAVINQNASGNKIDWFLQRSIRYRVHHDPASGLLQATVDVRLENHAPASGLPPILINSSAESIPPGENRTYLSVFTPWFMEGATSDGRPLLMESAVERGHRVYSTFISVPAGETKQISLKLSGRLDRPRYTVDVFNQTTVRPDDLRVQVSLPRGWRVHRQRGFTTSSSRHAELRGAGAGDLALELSARRTGLVSHLRALVAARTSEGPSSPSGRDLG